MFGVAGFQPGGVFDPGFQPYADARDPLPPYAKVAIEEPVAAPLPDDGQMQAGNGIFGSVMGPDGNVYYSSLRNGSVEEFCTGCQKQKEQKENIQLLQEKFRTHRSKHETYKRKRDWHSANGNRYKHEKYNAKMENVLDLMRQILQEIRDIKEAVYERNSPDTSGEDGRSSY